jgi:flagellin
MVQQIASTEASGSALSQARTSSAASIAALARQSGAGRIVVFESGGVSAANDPILAISGAGLAGEARVLARALANGRYGASLLQAAATALETIADKLARMKALAETISPATASAAADGGATSRLGRAVLHAEFVVLRSEIDIVAQSTQFDGAEILLGDGSGNPLDLTFRVGSGTAEGDGISVSIGPSTVADLSAGLASDHLNTMDAAATAATNVAAAIGQIDTIRSAVRGAGDRIAAASGTVEAIRAALAAAGDLRARVTVSIDTAQLLGERIVDDSGLAVPEVSRHLFRRLLLDAVNEGAATHGGGARTSPEGQSGEGRGSVPPSGASGESV